jgi:hypothetical protein
MFFRPQVSVGQSVVRWEAGGIGPRPVEQSGLHRSFRLNGKETAHAEFASIPARTRAGVAAPLETIATTNRGVQGTLFAITAQFGSAQQFTE